jgi:hypothetical protein
MIGARPAAGGDGGSMSVGRSRPAGVRFDGLPAELEAATLVDGQ